MTAADYKATRSRLGTQAKVAALLGVARGTVARRETGALPITTEAALALDALQARRERAERRTTRRNAGT
jgi:DNA-binding transcriptional regulator YdaS (Cro superfamily)